ncbi:MAG: proton-conducting transporter membrane subunit [Christensenellales bacterium]
MDASVAPPVSALHAVAVVKAGVFAVLADLLWFWVRLLRGSWADGGDDGGCRNGCPYSSAMALHPHLKRRLAYSTVGNLSYILFSVTLMTPAGLVGGLSHMVFHAVIKITLFFCAGAIIYKTHREYVYRLDGFGGQCR